MSPPRLPPRGARVIALHPRARPRFALAYAVALAACAPAETDTDVQEDTAPFVDDDFDGWPVPQDCDDTVPGVNPGAAEWCNGSDDDCDGLTDEHPVDGMVAWLDFDRDGWGGDATRDTWCGDFELDPRPWVSTGGDCDDGDMRVHPGANELCGAPGDEDCDGGTNDEGANGCVPWYLDLDGDGVGTEESACLCEAEASWRAAAPGDCDDGDPTVSAGCAMTGARALLDADVVIVGADLVDNAGDDVAPAGDPGGDGWPDVLVAGNDRRRAPVWWRMSGPFAASADLGAATARYTDTTFVEVNSQKVAGGQDLDGDGRDDVVLGAYGSVVSTGARMQGTVWLVSGDAGGEIDLAWADAVVTTPRTATTYLMTVAVSPDTDGDGIGDLVVGGHDASSIHVLLGPIAGTASTADADWRVEQSGTGFGYALAAPGDLDGDGLADVLVGAPYATGGGEVWVVRGGSTGVVPREATLAVLTGDDASRYAGLRVAGAGDVDGDGAPDVLVGGDPADFSISGAGVSWLVSGPFAGTMGLEDATARIVGNEQGDGASNVCGPGDMDGDGFADLAIGAPGFGWDLDGSGAVFVFFGPVAGDLVAHEADLRLYGGGTMEVAGAVLAPAGDIDRDGLPDLLVGAPGADLGGQDSGAAFLVRGGAR